MFHTRCYVALIIMDKYGVVVHGDKRDYEISIATEKNFKWANQSWGWFSLDKILIKNGKDATDEEWNKILTITQKMCNGINAT